MNANPKVITTALCICIISLSIIIFKDHSKKETSNNLPTPSPTESSPIESSSTTENNSTESSPTESLSESSTPVATTIVTTNDGKRLLIDVYEDDGTYRANIMTVMK